MSNDVNNVGGVQKPVVLQKQAPVVEYSSARVEITFSKGAAKDKPAEFNLYGKDIANFEKFKGNDKHDAMRMTTTAANDVKVQYMQLKHEFPDIVIEFEPMPDPRTCGKKREGFFTYQQQLEDWKDMALMQIANARETSTRQVVEDAARDIKANDDNNAVMNAEVTLAAAEAIMENDDKNAENINKNIDAEGAATRATVRREAAGLHEHMSIEGAATRNTTRIEGARTRNTVRAEGAQTRNLIREKANENLNAIEEQGIETRNTTRESAKQTQEIEALSDKISDIVQGNHTRDTIQKVGNLRDKIIASDVPHATKVELLNRLADFANQTIITNKALARHEDSIDTVLRNARRDFPESHIPHYEGQEPYPSPEPVVLEPEFRGIAGAGSTSSKTDGKEINNIPKESPQVPKESSQGPQESDSKQEKSVFKPEESEPLPDEKAKEAVIIPTMPDIDHIKQKKSKKLDK